MIDDGTMQRDVQADDAVRVVRRAADAYAYRGLAIRRESRTAVLSVYPAGEDRERRGLLHDVWRARLADEDGAEPGRELVAVLAVSPQSMRDDAPLNAAPVFISGFGHASVAYHRVCDFVDALAAVYTIAGTPGHRERRVRVHHAIDRRKLISPIEVAAARPVADGWRVPEVVAREGAA